MSWRKQVRGWLGRDPDFASRLCYSQDGEDLVLDRLLEGQQVGFFVDVGAHHPMRFSNTYLFYRRGWRGINIDAEPGSMRLFNKYRRDDTNIECGVGVQSGRLPYWRFNEPALNTFDEAEAMLKNSPPYRLIELVDVAVRRLDDLLKEHLRPGRTIDFLTIDVEGKDREVLESNDWDLYRPRLILAETLRTDMLSLSICPVVQFLSKQGYMPVAKTYNTTFFARVE